jgi:hypothetical protein
MTKKWWGSLSLEQQQAYNLARCKRHQQRISEMTPEELANYKIKQREGWQKFQQSLTVEQKQSLRETIKANARKKWANLPSKIKEKAKQTMKIRGKHVVERQKNLIISHYSNGTMKCAKCGFSDIRTLSIDHINGGGRKHAQELKKAGTIFYRWLIKNNFPEGYQVLCMNCNYIKKIENKEDTGHTVIIKT